MAARVPETDAERRSRWAASRAKARANATDAEKREHARNRVRDGGRDEADLPDRPPPGYADPEGDW